MSNLRSLDALLGMVTKRKGGREVVRAAIDALQAAFLTFLLPDRKLKCFAQQPLHVSRRPQASLAYFLFMVWCSKPACYY